MTLINELHFRCAPIAVGGVFLCPYSTVTSISDAACGDKGFGNPVLSNTCIFGDTEYNTSSIKVFWNTLIQKFRS